MSTHTSRLSICAINFGVFIGLLVCMGFVEVRSYVLLASIFMLGMATGLKKIPEQLNIITFLCVLGLGASVFYHYGYYNPLFQDDRMYLDEGLRLASQPYGELFRGLSDAGTITADNYKYVVGMILRLFERNYMGVVCMNFACLFGALSILLGASFDWRRRLLIVFTISEFIFWGGLIFKDVFVGLLILIQAFLLQKRKGLFLRIGFFLLSAFLIDEFKVGLGISTLVFGALAIVVKKNFLDGIYMKVGVMSLLLLILGLLPSYLGDLGVSATYADKIRAYADFAANKDLGSGLLKWTLSLPPLLTPIKAIVVPIPLALSMSTYGLLIIMFRAATFVCFLRWFLACSENNATMRFVNMLCVFWFSWVVVFMPGVFRHIVVFIPLIVYALSYEKNNSLPRWIPVLSWGSNRERAGHGGCGTSARPGIQQ